MSNEQASSEAQVQNDMILKQKEAIEKEIQASHQLIDVIEEVKVLETQFCNDPTFLKNAIQLQVCLDIADKQFFKDNQRQFRKIITHTRQVRVPHCDVLRIGFDFLY